MLTLWSCRVKNNINFVEIKLNVTMYLTLNTLSIVARDPGLSSLENLMVAGVGGSYRYHIVNVITETKATAPKMMTINTNATTIGAVSTNP